MNNAIKLIKSLNIYEDDKIILACSYGPDSMYLLALLQSLKLNIVVAHVNHKLRKESEKEYTDLKNYCLNNDIIFEGTSILKYPKGNIEAYGHQFRYQFFAKIIHKYHAKYLFTAHHGDDLTETILMRLARGSSFKGYAGFNYLSKRDDYEIVRPLVYLTKEEIVKYDDENNIPYAIDSSNLSLDYTRNKYRHEVLPILKEISPKIHLKMLKFSNTINEYNEYFEKEVNLNYSNLYLDNRLDLNSFNLLPNLLKKGILNKILFNIYGDSISKITDKHLELILNLIDSDKQNSYINLPNNVHINKFYNILEFNSGYNIKENYDYLFQKSLDLDLGTITQINETDILKSNYLIRLDSSEICLPLHVRTRRIGDKMEVKNLKHQAKIKDIFIDKKMPSNIRDIYPVVTDNNNVILWLPGIKKSKFDKQTNERYDIILKYIKKEKK